MDDAHAAASTESLQTTTPTSDAMWQLIREFIDRPPSSTSSTRVVDQAPQDPSTHDAPPANNAPPAPPATLFWKSLLDTSFFTTPLPESDTPTTTTTAAADAAYHTSRALAAEGALACSQYQALTACNVAIARRFRGMEAYATGMAAFVDGVGQRLDSVERMQAAAQRVDAGLRQLEARVQALATLVDSLADAATADS